ncbi:MAG: SDR family oxidoreductase [Planctomycetota bacterium]
MQNLYEKVIDCIATATRYPRQLLVADADLENDLGIDSVKRVEIVAALADEFGFDATAQERDDSVRTIGQTAAWVERIAAASPPLPAAAVTPTPMPSPPPSPSAARPAPELPPRFDSPLNSPPPATAAPVVVNGRHDPPHASEATNGSPVASPSPVAHPSEAPPSFPPSGSKPLQGRVALVTGSGHGVGRTVARLLASQGAAIIVNSFHTREAGDRTTSDIQAAGGTAHHLWGSVANPEHVEAMFRHVQQRFGYLDILVCNASDGRLGSFCDVEQDDWNRAFHTNVTGHHQCAMRARQLMEPRGGGSIVTMSSIASQRYVEGMGAQGVVKAAVESMTRYLACELAPYGIRSNCVVGGPVYGDVMEQYPEARATFNYWETIIPDGEMCSPLDLASTIAFLVSDAARGINGAIWTVDHGASARAHSRPLPTPPVAAAHRA